MSDRGNSEPVPNPKYLDLTNFVGLRTQVALKQAATQAAPQVRAPDGRRQWRTLDELSGTDDFRALMDREFPAAAAEWDDNVSRRNFLKVMGASLALAGLTSACAPKPTEKIVPYVQQPEHLVPGKPLFFASTMPWAGFGKGVLVEQHEGRPTKIEGNPGHPASLGSSDVWGQASILSLYDPDRSQVVTRFGNVSSWSSFVQSLSDALAYEDWSGAKARRRSKPAKVRVLTETVTSPTIKGLIESARAAVGGTLEWHAYDAVGRDAVREGAKRAFGDDVEPIYNFAAAATIVALDGNFLTDEPGSLAYARDYSVNRKIRVLGAEARTKPASRLYVVESVPTVAGAVADHTLRVRPDRVHAFAAALHAAVAAGKADGATFPGAEKWFGGLVTELLANKGRSVVVAGEYAPVEVHVLAHAINAALGNIAASAAEFQPSAHREPKPAGGIKTEVAAEEPGHEDHDHKPAPGPSGKGKPVALIPVVAATPANGVESLQKLVGAIKAGDADVVFILGGNPAYTAPAELTFADVLKAATPSAGTGSSAGAAGKPFVAHLGLHEDETARLCEWHIPETHWLEAWGDVRAYDGTASVVQPLIAPLYPSCKSIVEVLATLSSRAADTALTGAAPASRPATGPVDGSSSGYEIVRGVWQAWHGGQANAGGQAGAGSQPGAGGKPADFESFWTQTLHDGLVAGSAAAPKAGTFKADAADAAAKVPAVPSGMTLMFRPDPHVWDGQWANNAWLQELPKPLTTLTWDNALLISPKAALDLGLADDDKGHAFAIKFSEAQGKTVDLTVGGRTLSGVPVWVLPGHPDGCGTLYLGYGRSFAGRVGSPVDDTVGFNAYALRTADARWNLTGADPKPTGKSYQLAVTQTHQVINRDTNHKRELVIAGTDAGEVASEFAHEFDVRSGVPEGDGSHSHGEFKYDADKNIALARRVGLPILPDDPDNSQAGLFPYTPDQPNKYETGAQRDKTPGSDLDRYAAWGMVIDQSACIGCNACVIACQAENNIPVVGKEQVIREREMHWIRIDTYYVGKPPEGDEEHGYSNTVGIAEPESTYFQPMTCQQCEKAPCELVCPVGATIHSKEGLNDMAYNRCVGTRYCSNNCPYKVRRFNFLKYQDDTTPVLKLLRNPEVTVRSRGVMEKCTYCVQRISRGRIEAKKREVAALTSGTDKAAAQEVYNKVLREVTTACAQACPTQVITFGNIADPKSDIYQLKREPVGFHYGVLAELNTRPRTSYLAKISNPQPGTGGGHKHGGDEKHGGGEGGPAHPPVATAPAGTAPAAAGTAPATAPAH
jgi:MoCo/4Fe-4S cofactor protein with predicted Tat translocation signal